jgi:hypothetical protein
MVVKLEEATSGSTWKGAIQLSSINQGKLGKQENSHSKLGYEVPLT